MSPSEDSIPGWQKSPVDHYSEAIKTGAPFRRPDGVVEYPTTSSLPPPERGLNGSHKALLALGMAIPLVVTVLALPGILSTPGEVPLQWGFDGEVTRTGPASEVLWGPAIMMPVLVGCAVLVRYPRIYNYGFHPLTEHDVQAQYRNAQQMMVWLVFSMGLMVPGMLLGTTVEGAFWLIGLSAVLLVGSMLFFMLRLRRLRPQ